MNLLFGLIASTIVGSGIFFTLILLRPITTKMFSNSWHYCCLIVPLAFLLGGTHIAIGLFGLMPNPDSVNTLPTPITQEIASAIPSEANRIPTFDNVLNMPVHGEEVSIGLEPPPSVISQFLTHFERAVPFLLAIWVLGAILFIVISTKKYLQYRYAVLHNAQNVIDIDCKIPITVSIIAHTPMLLGVIKPIIVLPNMYFSDKEMEMILAHEMVHYRRKDLFVKLLMLIANALHWFNPVVYALNRSLNTACELSCDEKVVSEMDTQNRRLYGETLLQVLKYSTAQRNVVGNVAFATNLCSSKKNFKRRLISTMNTKKMKKSITVLALATGALIIGGGFALANTVSSAMPVVSVYASELMIIDYSSDLVAPSLSPNVSTPQQNISAQTEEATGGHIPLWGWSEDSEYFASWGWGFAPIGYVNELPFTIAPITNISELADFATHYSVGNVLLPTYIPQGFNFAYAEFPGWQNHIFTAITEMPVAEVQVVAAEAYAPLHAARWGFDMNDWVGEFHWTGQILPLEDGRNRLVYFGGESTLIDVFDWEVAAITPHFDTLRIYFTHENNHLTTITVWVREYRGWGWNDPEMWPNNMSEITVNGMSGYMSGTELHLIDTDANITYTIVSSSSAAANEATLIRIAESLM